MTLVDADLRSGRRLETGRRSESINIHIYIIVIKMSNAVGRGFEPRSCQTKDYKIGICCFSTKHVALRRKSKDWLALNQDSVSEWGDMSISGAGHPAPPPPPKIVKNMIFWRKIVIFHTKYPKNFRASLRSAQFFQVRPPPPPNLKSWIRPCI